MAASQSPKASSRAGTPGKEARFHCRSIGCSRKFASTSTRNRHQRTNHEKEIVCKLNGCESMMEAEYITMHQANHYRIEGLSHQPKSQQMQAADMVDAWDYTPQANRLEHYTAARDFYTGSFTQPSMYSQQSYGQPTAPGYSNYRDVNSRNQGPAPPMTASGSIAPLSPPVSQCSLDTQYTEGSLQEAVQPEPKTMLVYNNPSYGYQPPRTPHEVYIAHPSSPHSAAETKEVREKGTNSPSLPTTFTEMLNGDSTWEPYT